MKVCPHDVIVGLDRSDKKADLCLIDVRTGQRRSVGMAPGVAAARVGLCLLDVHDVH